MAKLSDSKVLLIATEGDLFSAALYSTLRAKEIDVLFGCDDRYKFLKNANPKKSINFDNFKEQSCDIITYADYDLIVQVGLNTRCLSNLRGLRVIGPTYLLVVSDLDTAFSRQRTGKVRRLTREMEAADLVLCASFTSQTAAESFNPRRPCKLLPWSIATNNATPSEPSPAHGTGVVQNNGADPLVVFVGGEFEFSQEFYGQLVHSRTMSDIHEFVIECEQVSASGDERTDMSLLTRRLIAAQKEYRDADLLLFVGNVASDPLRLALARRSGTPIIYTDSECAEDFLEGGQKQRVIPIGETSDTILADLGTMVGATKKDEVDTPLIDPSELSLTIDVFCGGLGELNSFPQYASDLRASKLAEDKRPIAIFYYPFAIEADRRRARTSRLLSMRRALANKYNVIELYGSVFTKMRRLRLIQDALAEGLDVAFCYMETGTSPFSPKDGENYDEFILKKFKKADIPIFIYVRDAHWREPVYEDIVGVEAATEMRVRGESDFEIIHDVAQVVGSPSDRFYASYVRRPDRFVRNIPLPPGCDLDKFREIEASSKSQKPSSVHLVYAGGLSELYNVDLMLSSAMQFNNLQLRLTVLSRPDEIDMFLANRPHIRAATNIHLRCGDLFDFASKEQFDAGMLLLSPTEYAKTSVPKKMIDYLTCGLPIIANTGCVYSEIIQANKIGLTLKPTTENVDTLFGELVSGSKIISNLKSNIINYVLRNQWDDRVESIERSLNFSRKDVLTNKLKDSVLRRIYR